MAAPSGVGAGVCTPYFRDRLRAELEALQAALATSVQHRLASLEGRLVEHYGKQAAELAAAIKGLSEENRTLRRRSGSSSTADAPDVGAAAQAVTALDRLLEEAGDAGSAKAKLGFSYDAEPKSAKVHPATQESELKPRVQFDAYETLSVDSASDVVADSAAHEYQAHEATASALMCMSLSDCDSGNNGSVLAPLHQDQARHKARVMAADSSSGSSGDGGGLLAVAGWHGESIRGIGSEKDDDRSTGTSTRGGRSMRSSQPSTHAGLDVDTPNSQPKRSVRRSATVENVPPTRGVPGTSRKEHGSVCGSGVTRTRSSARDQDRFSPQASEHTGRLSTTSFQVLSIWSLDGGPGWMRKRLSSRQMTMNFGSLGSRGTVEGEERLEELLNPKLRWFMMHPTGMQHLAWDLFGLMLIFYDCTMVPFEVFDPPEDGFFMVMTWTIRLFWTVNMGLSFFVGYMRDDGMVEMRPLRVAKRYIFTWFLLDAFVVSFDWAELYSDFNGNNLNRVGTTLRGLRMLRTVRLFRLLKAPMMTNKLSEYVPMSEQLGLLATTAKIMFAFLWVTHVVACLWYGVGRMIRSLGSYRSWLEVADTDDMLLSERYVLCLHWSLAAFSGDTSVVLPSNVWERFLAMSILFVAFVVTASVVGGITTSMTRLQIMLSEQTSKMSALRRFLVDHGISRPLAVRVQRNAQHAMLEQKSNAPESSIELLGMISQPVLVEVHYEIHSRVILAHPFMLAYSDINPAGMRRVCHSAVSMVSLHPKDILYNAFEVPERPKMFFIISGKLLYQQNRKAEMVERGSWTCEASLWTTWTHTGTLKALAESRLLVIDAHKFQDIISSFPSDHAGLYATAFVDWLNERVPAEQDDAGPNKEALAGLVRHAFPVEGDSDDEESQEGAAATNRSTSMRSGGNGAPRKTVSMSWSFRDRASWDRSSSRGLISNFLPKSSTSSSLRIPNEARTERRASRIRSLIAVPTWKVPTKDPVTGQWQLSQVVPEPTAEPSTGGPGEDAGAPADVEVFEAEALEPA